MADGKMALWDVLSEGEEPGADFPCESPRWLAHQLMEAEVSGQIRAERSDHGEERVARRNGYRIDPRDTRGERSVSRFRSPESGATSRPS